MFKITDFKGEIPRRNSKLLPIGYAQEARNIRFEDGAIHPLRQPLAVETLATEAISFVKHQGAFLSWTQGKVSAAPGPVAQERLYYTLSTTEHAKMLTNGTEYDLRLPGPNTKPSLERLNEQVFPATNDPNAAIDLSAYQGNEPPVIEGPDGTGAGEPYRLIVAQSPEWSFFTQTRRQTTPAILHVLDINGVLCTTDNTTRAVMQVTDPEMKLHGSVHGTAVNGVITITGTALYASWEGFNNSATNLPIKFSAGFGEDGRLADGLVNVNIDVPDKEVKSEGIPGIPASMVVVRQPEAGVDDAEFVTLPAIAVLDAFGNVCEGLDGFEVKVRVIEGTNAALRGNRTAKTFAGLARYDLSNELRLTGAHEDDIVLEFFAEGLEPVASDPVTLTENRTKLTEEIVYTYTFVTQFDEESPPAPLSSQVEWYPGVTFRLTGFASPVASRGVNRMRIYRSVTSFSGVTDLYFVAEIPIASSSYDHDIETAPIAEILPSNDYDPPPLGMMGLVSMPNGMMAAFSGREVLFSEPYRPHAWPVKYRLLVDHPIVGLVSFGSALAILTDTSPYIAQGMSPETIVMEKIEQNLPCVSFRSIVDLGYAAAFATHEGLAVIGMGQQGQVATRQLFTRDQWQAMQPETIDAEQYLGRYVFSYINPDDGLRTTGMIDLSGDLPFFVRVDIPARTFSYDAPSGKLYMMVSGTEISEFDAENQPPMEYTWRSGKIALPGHVNIPAALVQSDPDKHSEAAPETTVSVYANGALKHSFTALDAPQHLPSGFLANEWQVSLVGNKAVSHVYMGGSFYDIGMM